MPKDCMLIAEGYNTMDVSRTMLHSSLPRHRSLAFYVISCYLPHIFTSYIYAQDTMLAAVFAN